MCTCISQGAVDTHMHMHHMNVYLLHRFSGSGDRDQQCRLLTSPCDQRHATYAHAHAPCDQRHSQRPLTFCTCTPRLISACVGPLLFPTAFWNLTPALLIARILFKLFPRVNASASSLQLLSASEDALDNDPDDSLSKWAIGIDSSDCCISMDSERSSEVGWS